MKERFRDKTRDELTASLNALGVQAEMSRREVVQEKAENSWYQRSLGVIDVFEEPIRWINILKKDRSDKSPPAWWVVFGIPDDRPISSRHTVKIKTVRKKTFPLFGRVVDVTWKGSDGFTGLVKTLSNDEPIKMLAKRVGNLEIKSHVRPFQGWTLTTYRRIQPTREDWESIKKLADYMLESPRRL